MKKLCLYCGEQITGSGEKFCSSEHCNLYHYQQKVKAWLDGLDEGWSGTGIKKFVRRYMLQKNNYKCEKCGWGEKNPYSNLVPLEIHHKDGNYKNNTLENLQVLCPNCHSLTDTYKSMNKDSARDRTMYIGRKQQRKKCIDCGKEISEKATRCKQCESKTRIIPLNEMPVNREELKNLIRTTPFTTIGKQFGVSDNAIRKWCDKFNLPKKSREIKNYSDQEWALI